jgi:oligopeptide transport system substrate-binding protein
MKKMMMMLVLLLTIIGCGKAPVKQWDKLHLNFQEGDLPSLHPHELVIYLRGLSIAKALFEPLTRISAEGKVELAGAEKVELSEDQLHYTFTLRENHWSDGSLVSAHHFEKAWKAALAPLSSCSRADLLYPLENAVEAKKGICSIDLVGVHAIDDKTLKVDLAFPSPHFLELVAQAITAPLVDPDNKENILFNGPFMVDLWKKGSVLRLKPNPYYWDREHITLKQIDISFIEDINTAYTLYEKGEIDWMGVPFCPLSAELILRLKENNLLKSHPIGRSFWVFLNTKDPLLASPSIRKALSFALDRKAITSHVLIGGNPSLKPLSLGLLPLKPGQKIEENLEKAKSAFEKGLAELGLNRATCPPLEISYSQQAMRKQLAEYLQETWHNVLGIEVKLKSVEWNVLRSNLEKGLFAVSMAYEGAFYKDPLELLERYTSDTPSNFSQWINPSFVKKIQVAKYETDDQRRLYLLSEAEEILLEQMPFIPICSDCVLFTHPPEMKGYVIDSIGALDLSRVTLEKGE